MLSRLCSSGTAVIPSGKGPIHVRSLCHLVRDGTFSSKGFSGVTTLPLCPTLSWDPTPCLFSLHSYTLPTSSFTSSEKLSPRGVGQVSKPYWTGSVLTTYTVCMFWLQFVWIATTSQNTNAIHLYCILPYSEWSLRFRTHIREGFRYTCIHDRTYFPLVLD